jgi:hypothetical protein
MLRSSPLRVAAFVVIASLAIGGIFYEANAQATPLQYSMRATGGKVPIASAVAGSKSSNGSSTAAIPMHAVHIANDGLTYVQGASVASIGNGTISIALAWGGATFNWTVTTNSNTKFYSKSGEKGTIEGIQVGDYIDVTGALAQGGATPIIAAQFIRE